MSIHTCVDVNIAIVVVEGITGVILHLVGKELGIAAFNIEATSIADRGVVSQRVITHGLVANPPERAAIVDGVVIADLITGDHRTVAVEAAGLIGPIVSDNIVAQGCCSISGVEATARRPGSVAFSRDVVAVDLVIGNDTPIDLIDAATTYAGVAAHGDVAGDHIALHHARCTMNTAAIGILVGVDCVAKDLVIDNLSTFCINPATMTIIKFGLDILLHRVARHDPATGKDPCAESGIHTVDTVGAHDIIGDLPTTAAVDTDALHTVVPASGSGAIVDHRIPGNASAPFIGNAHAIDIGGDLQQIIGHQIVGDDAAIRPKPARAITADGALVYIKGRVGGIDGIAAAITSRFDQGVLQDRPAHIGIGAVNRAGNGHTFKDHPAPVAGLLAHLPRGEGDGLGGRPQRNETATHLQAPLVAEPQFGARLQRQSAILGDN